ncbi:MAG: 2-dehydropantoate 2-reductase [Planctomycetes bacterium]|nr:2-dehydropantoate 2-reductase [Planctomycetota bacterium]
MKTIETISWIGLGSLGCAYLSRIFEFLPVERIRVIASGARAQRLRQGVRVNGRTIRFPIADPADPVAPADLLVFAVKHHHLPQAILDVQNHVGPDTIILSLLNGISSEHAIGQVYGPDRVLYAYSVKIDATRVDDAVTFTTLGLIPFGEAVNPPGSPSEKVRRVGDFFTRTGIDFTIPEDMVRSLWTKFMLNVGVNQVSAVLRSPYGPLQRAGKPRDLALAAMLEVAALAPKAGVPLTPDDAHQAITAIDALSPRGKTSMLQDIEAGRKTEVDLFGGTVVSMAREHGLAVPVNEMLLRIILCLETLPPQGS